MSYGSNSQGPVYTAPPPEYVQTDSAGTSSAREPFLGREWENDNVPDDFKIGVSVGQCDIGIRMAFVRKVYSILAVQLFLTMIMGAVFMYNESAKNWVQSNNWAVWVSLISTFVLLFALIWKRRSYPANYILLGLFTFAEAYSIGVTVTFYSQVLVLQALIITFSIFVALTLFTLQTQWDFSGMFPFLYGALWLVVILGFVQIFIPFNKTFDLILATGIAIVFCGYIIFDTYNLMHRLSPEEYVMAAVELYLDIINLFLAILRILNDLRD
ncbi:8779_t:CDS:2 [Paraglomus occultum]|uniref:8779_t:CDS:1 n=1 Tax=Paraglomus occultum TaxID=144539 RepID=A0A9N9ADS9_9GLOM|nr:8779_t:CDS:2 [Paraglomus occultum]